jgi:hypothetical protein
VDSQLFFAAGKSPLYASNKPENPIGTWLSKDPAKFPFTVFVGMRAYCVSPCVASLAFQQSYEGWATIFYGEPAHAKRAPAKFLGSWHCRWFPFRARRP